MTRHRVPPSLVLLASALFATAALHSSVEGAATITVVNTDGPGEGFNDPTPATPVGGNPGTTLGAQRLNAFNHAASIWASLITSAVEIKVAASFDPLPCSASGAVLGAAGPISAFSDFTGALVPNTFYPVALANALHGSDLDPGADPNHDDIAARFSSSIGTTCPFPRTWYYGFDGNPSATEIDFLSVLLHELGHGLGFLTFMNVNTGAKLMGQDDVFELHLEDHGATPPDFPSMTNAQRSAASADTGNLHWVGPNVMAAAAAGALTAGATVDNHVRMYAPNPKQEGSSVSHWDTVLTPSQLMEPIYTGPLLSPVLELPLFQDIGWTVSIPATPNIHVEPPAKNYGKVSEGDMVDRDFTVTNTGQGTLHVTATSIVPDAGTNPGEFSITNGVNNFNLTANQDITVTVRFAPDASGGNKSALLRFVSDDPDQPTRDVPLTGVALVPTHDLAVVKIVAPALVSMGSSPVTKPVTVQIQNRSNHPEVLPNATILGDGVTAGSLVQLTVTVVDGDGENCAPAVVVLDPAKTGALFRRGAKTIPPKAKLTLNYNVTYSCPSAKPRAQSASGDYSYTATVHHDVLGAPDGHPADDVCPRAALGIDPNPDGTINDKGCPAKTTNVTGR